MEVFESHALFLGHSSLSSGSFLKNYALQSGNMEAATNMMAKLAAQLLLILTVVHANGFVQGDLKSENVAVVEVAPKEFQIRLIDFDLSARLELVRAHAGTRLTISPEVVGAISGPLHEASDWWSYGVTLLWWSGGIMQGIAEYKKDNSELQKWKMWIPETWNRATDEFVLDASAMAQHLPPRIRCFILNFITDNPSKRRFIEKNEILQLMKSSLFSSINWNDILKSAFPNSSGGKSISLPTDNIKMAKSVESMKVDIDDLEDN